MAETDAKNQKSDPGKDNLTPLMQQYRDIKSQYPGMLLFFRLGDFYEMFGEDAKKASAVLEVVLTARQGIPMCGVPYHSVNSYLKKLIKNGEKIAICEQLEEPGAQKGIVRRGVVRVITPGTILEENLLTSKENNYLVSVFMSADRSKAGIASVDISTGEFITTETDSRNLKNELLRLNPGEIIIPESHANEGFLKEVLQGIEVSISSVEDWRFDFGDGKNNITAFFKVQSLKPFGLDDKKWAISAIGGMLAYLEKTQNDKFPHFSNIRYYSLEDYLLLDPIAVKNLELVEGINTRTKENSLLEVIDFTLTPMGGRLLRNWLLRPLLDRAVILERQDSVSFFADEGLSRRKIRELLKGISDIERILSRTATFSAYPREIIALKNSLSQTLEIRRTIENSKDLVSLPKSLKKLAEKLSDQKELCDFILKAVVAEPPAFLKDGGVIKEGYDKELDELRSISSNGKGYISRLEAEERQKTGITNLKVGYTSVFGYFIEITRSNLGSVPQNYIRKQTLTNAERFITPELKALEEKIITAEEKMIKLEQKLYRELLEKVLEYSKEVLATAQGVAEIDVYCSLAEAALDYGYTRPEINDGYELSIKEGRHPFVERKIKSGTFVSNDTLLNADTDQIILLTGPNMAGKSTYLRQAALIVILAQIGSFVPAAEARVGITDRIFTRIGAGDNLAQNESTFMVEMHETANILNQYTPRSLIILDEVGRGTSTYDGISIAWAAVEYLRNARDKENRGPKVLFATHYFELTELENKMPGIKNYNVSVKEWQNEVIFLHKIVPGAADKSYGIHVAKLAGLPKEVIRKANKILLELENNKLERSDKLPDTQLEFVSASSPTPKILIELDKLDTNSLTPLEALEIIDRWKKENS